jgi:hypothetical protein
VETSRVEGERVEKGLDPELTHLMRTKKVIFQLGKKEKFLLGRLHLVRSRLYLMEYANICNLCVEDYTQGRDTG